MLCQVYRSYKVYDYNINIGVSNELVFIKNNYEYLPVY